MNNQICAMVGCDFPLFAFTHCRDVVVAVSKAGGFGVLGGSSFTPEQLEVELKWIDEHIDGKPYGVDILIPEHTAVDMGKVSGEQVAAQISHRHLEFAAHLLNQYGVEATPEEVIRKELPPISPQLGEALLDVAFRHPIRLIVSALGIAPQPMIERARRFNVPVGALVGAKEHAVRQVKAGVDVLIAQGCEAGGHCGEVSTLVLVPEVVRAIRPIREVPVLAAGGIMTGRQMAGCMAMGAQGAWTGSIWLSTLESETSEAFREKMVAATSRDTIRSQARTGKPARQLRSAWHDAWHGKDSPGPLGMPHMSMVSQPAFDRIDKAVAGGHREAMPLVSYFVGQGVGLVDSIKSAGDVVQEFKEEFGDAVMDLQSALE